MDSPDTPKLPEHQPIPPEMDLHCCNCGYELTGLTVRRCPECGEIFNAQETYRINKRTSWEYLLGNRCSSMTYPFFLLIKGLGFSPSAMEQILRRMDAIFYTFLAGFTALFVILSLWEPAVLAVLVLWIPAELMIYWFGWGKFLIRSFTLICCFLWAIIVFI